MASLIPGLPERFEEEVGIEGEAIQIDRNLFRGAQFKKRMKRKT
jgi:hypothetical protein